MKWRAKWSHVVIALGLIAAVAIASPAFGISKSIKKAIKREVAKQIGKATGPAGANGTNGTNGANGANGTARAYARVLPPAAVPCVLDGGSGCHFDHDKGVAAVTHTASGSYCVTAPGISHDAVPAAVSVDTSTTVAPGNASTMIDVESLCLGDAFRVVTQRQPSTAVRNAADNGSINVAGNAAAADDVGFTIVIP
jgi:hypothetical protein